MRYRQYLHKGKTTDRIDATEGQFGTPDEVGIAEVAVALGVPASEVTVLYADVDPVGGAEVRIPPTVAEPVPLTLSGRLEALLDAIASAKDLAELKTAAADIKAGRG